MNTLLQDVDARGIGRITLNRPERHNAFDDAMIAELTDALRQMDVRNDVRIVVLASNGTSFCAGADLNWMQRIAAQSAEENEQDAAALAALMQVLDGLRKPTLAMLQGAAYGGGVGLVACCDIAIAADTAQFCLSEVRLGLIPAVIGPYVVAAIGARQARRYFLSAERIPALQAAALGLVHQVVPLADLETTIETILNALLQGGPEAQQAAKVLVHSCAHETDPDALRQETICRIAACRASAEGREGMAAFLERRSPYWKAIG